MAGGINRSDETDDLSENHEINVVPFIDIMLVLLVIFMVAAPLATVDVAVDLPSSTAEPQERPDAPLYLTLKDDLSLALGDDDIARAGLTSALDAFTEGDRKTRVFLRADRSVDYGELMELMNDLRAAGYLQIALVGLERTDVSSSGAVGTAPNGEAAAGESGAEAPDAPGGE